MEETPIQEKPMKETTLKEKAYARLRDWVMNGYFKHGEFLTERSLVEKLEMSRTPIRAALERLESEGYVRYTPNKGIFVTEPSMDQVIHFYDFRVAIESYVVRKLAAASFAPDSRAWLEENLARQQASVDTGDYSLFTMLDSSFHRQLAVLHGNREIVQTMERLQDRLYQIAIKVLQKDNERIQVSYRNHVDIYRHIVAGDAEAAAHDMIEHLEFGKRILLF